VVNKRIRLAVISLIAIIVLSLVIYPFAATTGKVTISQTAVIGSGPVNTCSDLSIWSCIIKPGCDWNWQFRTCARMLNCPGLPFDICSNTHGCNWQLDYDGRPYSCTCVDDDGSKYIADICYNCLKDPLEDGIDCGGVCKKDC